MIPLLVSLSGLIETPNFMRSKVFIVADRLVIPRLDRGIQETGLLRFLDTGSGLPRTGYGVRYDEPVDFSQPIFNPSSYR
jgi:hypothetical protein